eukprot:CAMPEP_0175836976 /NCGR_PEP_ID=MMETSP0107_2-20121207/17436_1 /TAXON_ID=195067 ORGANISM="Goniomonas pacifica, Strain CCMP1869" /NCGR_SAMPLE_ID=MMETSP0107_2 /ASSEMBLY_ACC=CAM_ASM_000203 /LENGTH=52 /DNA_ID=CAMNT_0017150419 /DNA_START=248 /DNA_END=406 /DNA_ORIENTATION=+
MLQQGDESTVTTDTVLCEVKGRPIVVVRGADVGPRLDQHPAHLHKGEESGVM